MPGAPDPLYVAARSVLLDALEALSEHLDAIVLVGAQAVYLHTAEADLAVAPYTTDSDLALNPRELSDQPLLEELMHAGAFEGMARQVGRWVKPTRVSGTDVDVIVDLLVPESLGGAGRRAARIPPHAVGVARKVRGLEGVRTRSPSVNRAPTDRWTRMPSTWSGSCAPWTPETLSVASTSSRSTD